MRNSKLANIATRLADTATEIAESINNAFHMRERLLREVRNSQRCAQSAVPREMLGMAGRGYREHVERNLASLIVHEAIKSIDFDVRHELNTIHANTVFTARAYVLTQDEMTKLIDDAIEIGKRS